MNKPEDLLQERLEQLESGASPEICIQGLPDIEADLLKLTYRLRQLQYPVRDDKVVVSQRQALLNLVAREKKMKNAGELTEILLYKLVTWTRSFRSPHILIGGAVLAVIVCIFAASILTGLLRSNTPPFSTLQDITSQEPTAPGTTPIAVREDRSSTEAAPATTESEYNIFIPMLTKPLTLSPQQATLQNIRGLVEIQTKTGAWASVPSIRALSVGQRVRTGPLSSASLVFYDGSQAHLGPNTEVSIDELDARTEGGPRVVVLTQWVGRSEHNVATVVADNSRYNVRTPSATSSAEGTQFYVVVTPARRAHFYVMEGTIAVTGRETTVLVEAGETTAVDIDAPPEEPAFRITGEGVVSNIGTSMGEPWIIAGQPFDVYTDTVITGDPQVGDWVSVEGYLRTDNTRVVREITLVRRSPVNQFTLTGRVEMITDDAWTIAGQNIMISTTTQIDIDIEVGTLVRVEGIIKDSGVLQASSISRQEEGEGSRRLPFNFTGVVQAIEPESWMISGVTLAVNSDTQVDRGIAVGDLVRARGWIQADGTWYAYTIEWATKQTSTFSFTGPVEHIQPWQVSGIAFKTHEWTLVDKGISVGDEVRVTGQISDDGTWVAFEIEKIDEETKIGIILIGTLTGMDPWSVNNIPLVVDATTIITGDLEVGILVRVEIQLLADGTWRVLELQPYEIEWGQGCLMLRAIVASITEEQIQLAGWPPIDLGEDADTNHPLEIEGTLEPGSVIWLQICLTEDGEIKILYIIVIDQPVPEEVTPLPTESPPVQEDPDSKVTICHKPNAKNPHTITISRSALQTHLDHGDTLGPCP